MGNYINLPSGFNVTTTLPIDKRLVMTKAEMLATKKPQMPDYYFVLCSEDQRIYIYDKSIVTPDPVLGRFQPLENFLTFDSAASKAKFEAALENSTKIQNIETTLGDAQERTGVFQEIDAVDAKIDVVDEKVTQVENRVDVLEPKVTNLEVKVGDDNSGLIKRITDAEADIEVVEEDIDQAQEDITVIQNWINNVKLDGGEIKVTYDLIPVLTNVIASGSNPTTINYKGGAELLFEAASGYILPSSITINEVIVGPIAAECGTVTAQWLATSGKLILTNATGDVTYTITGITEG